MNEGRLGRKSPIYDGRVTGFRIYMLELDDPTQKWCNVATIDALRGVVTYEGCNIEQHPWIPRGYPRNDLWELGMPPTMISEGSGWMAKRFEHGDSTDGDSVIPVHCWSNRTTGRNQNKCKHDGKSVNFIHSDDMPDHSITYNFETGDLFDYWIYVQHTDPYEGNKIKESVNIESISDITYELLNGYKEIYSPTSAE